MAGFTDYMEGLVMAWMNGSAMPAAPAALYVGLFDGDPTDTGTGGSEITTTVRAAGRVAGTFNRVVGQLTNGAETNFGSAAASAHMTHWGVFDAAAAGHLLQYGPLDSVRDVSAGTRVFIPAGSMVLDLT